MLWRWWRTASVRFNHYPGIKVIHAVWFLPNPNSLAWHTLPEGFTTVDGKKEPAYVHMGPDLAQPPIVDYLRGHEALELELDVPPDAKTLPGPMTYDDDGKVSGKYHAK